MLVFYKERLVFLAIPKTGTTAYHSALRAHADIVVSDPPGLKHAPLYRFDRFFRPMFEKICDVEMETLAVMREPISWLGSWYRYRQRSYLQNKSNSTKGISFDDFVLAYLKGRKPDYANVGSQANFLKPRSEGTAVTHLFRYEEPEALNAFLQDRLNMKLSLKRENVSPEMVLKLSPKTEERYRRKCAEEFALYESIR